MNAKTQRRQDAKMRAKRAGEQGFTRSQHGSGLARRYVERRSVSVSRRTLPTGTWPEGPKQESPGQRPGYWVSPSVHALKGHDINSIPQSLFIPCDHGGGRSNVLVAPLQGLACSGASTPRALPWAVLLQPFRGKAFLSFGTSSVEAPGYCQLSLRDDGSVCDREWG